MSPTPVYYVTAWLFSDVKSASRLEETKPWVSLKRCLGRACYDTDTAAGVEKRRWGSFSFRQGLRRLFSQENVVALLKMIIASWKMKWQVAGRVQDGTGEKQIVLLQLTDTTRHLETDPRAVSWHLLTSGKAGSGLKKSGGWWAHPMGVTPDSH